MKTRVTITLDPATFRAAKRTARSRSTTFSGLVETLLASVNSGTSLVDGMIGSAELREAAPGSDPLGDALRRKYLRS
jgi:hypothetical protein